MASKPIDQRDFNERATSLWREQLKHGKWVRTSDLMASIPSDLWQAYLGCSTGDGWTAILLHALARLELWWVFKARFIASKGHEVRVTKRGQEIRLRKQAQRKQATPKSGAKRQTASLQPTAAKTQKQATCTYQPEFATKCAACLARVDEWHRRGCYLEQCPYCGRRAGSCGCPTVQQFGTIPGDDRLRFDGYLPGSRDACRLAWFCRFGRNRRRIPCAPEVENAVPDTLRVLEEAHWDREAKQFVLPATSVT